MALGDITVGDLGIRSAPAHAGSVVPAEAEARRALRRQIAGLGDGRVISFSHGGVDPVAPAHVPAGHGPPVLGLGELETLRGELTARLRDARPPLEALGREQERHRERLERMLVDPAGHGTGSGMTGRMAAVAARWSRPAASNPARLSPTGRRAAPG